MTTPCKPLLALVLSLSLSAWAQGTPADAKSREWFTDTVLVNQEGKPVRFSRPLDARRHGVGGLHVPVGDLHW